ncbi:MAG TPA: GNAT family N-acetyltransferase [Acidobacteriota bacterium]|nr:GNAT family N-acetyltransferase [Acidobacteriota bacterium]
MPLPKPLRESIVYSDDPARVDVPQLLDLYRITWWAADRTLEQVRRALDHSRPVITAWDGTRLVGFTRVISDLTYRATIWDVIVADTHQKLGIGREMMRRVLGHPELESVTMFLLLTKDRHRFYEHLGFETDRELSMILRRRPAGGADSPRTH